MMTIKFDGTLDTAPPGWVLQDGDAVSPEWFQWDKENDSAFLEPENGVRESGYPGIPCHALLPGESWYLFDVSTLAEPPVTSADLLAECIRTMEEKGKDYRTQSGRPFSNFETASQLAGITSLQSWLVYFTKHVTAISKYCREEKVHSEPIRGRIVDAINYLILLDQEIEARKADPK